MSIFILLIKDNICQAMAQELLGQKENAIGKLNRKNLDFIVGNDITANDTGFGVEDNKVIILSKDNKEYCLEKMSKEKVAGNLFDIILKKR